MKTILYLIIGLSLFLFPSNSKGQDIYHTQSAKMKITVISSDTVLTITNNEVLILLHFENARFTMKMDESNFKTGVDSLDKKLARLKYNIIEYVGKLGIDRIDVNDEFPISFDVEGVLSTNNHIIKGTGNLDHIANRGMFSGIITLKFNLKLDDLGLELNGLNLDDDIEIEIVQELLNKLKD